MHKGLTFLVKVSLKSIKYLKLFLPKETLLDTTISLISVLSIEIGLYVGEICVIQFQYHQTL